MRYHTTKGEFVRPHYGVLYECSHPLYDTCTLYSDDEGRGLAVIQQYRDTKTKTTSWGPVYPWLWDGIYMAARFRDVFAEYASWPDRSGLYPTVPVRKLMWRLRMKPLPRQPWETDFNRFLL